ncbi:MAG: 16S rRNA (adenine(1518)-N(6)/adenine(1519)-N(6))-dimethyltransferase RsmA [bacterium]
MNIHPKKSLGQNFLNSGGAINTIVETGRLKKGDTVLEIGPGKGALTKKLLETGADVFAIEKDDLLIPVLEELFEKEISSGKLRLIHGDVLEFDPKEYKLEAQKYKLIANIPYYITGELIRRFLSEIPQPELMVILVQKEVAERIVVRDGKESILSISVKVYGEPKYIQTVKAGSFFPAPNVDSAILLIDNISKKNFSNIDEQKFFKIVRAGFAHKRKTISSNLKEFISKERLNELGINEKERAEKLSLEQWIKLSL